MYIEGMLEEKPLTSLQETRRQVVSRLYMQNPSSNDNVSQDPRICLLLIWILVITCNSVNNSNSIVISII